MRKQILTRTIHPFFNPKFSLAAFSTSAQDRPISPDVTIYKFPIQAISSITNRVSGAGLSAGVFGMALLGLSGSCDIPIYVEAFKESAPFLVPFAKIIVGGPLLYHYLGGLRHLYWDYTAKGLDLKTTKLTSQVLIGTTIALTLGLAFYSIEPNKKLRKKLQKREE